jgi:predicted TIM-barrel enzyme
VGSGISADNIAQFAAADALIVGSSIKKDGLWSNPIDPQRTQALITAFNQG